MSNKENILEETLGELHNLYSPANDRISKIQLSIATSMIKGMISIQKASEKIGDKMKRHLQDRIKTKGR